MDETLLNEISNFNYGLDILNQNPKEQRVYNSLTIPFHLKSIKTALRPEVFYI